MTNYELQKVARMTAQYLVEALKQDDSLIDSILPPRYMTIEEASRFCCIPVGTLYQKIAQIPHRKVGKRLIFSDRALARWINHEVPVDKSIKLAV